MADQEDKAEPLGALMSALGGGDDKPEPGKKEKPPEVNVTAMQAFEDFADTAASSGTRMHALEALVRLLIEKHR